MTSLPDQANKTAKVLKGEVAFEAPVSAVQEGEPPQYSYQNSNNIRTRYLSRLGIFAKPHQKKVIPSKINVPTQKIPSTRQHPKADAMSQQAEESRKGRSVSFDEAVTIRSIPSRFQYPLKIRQDLWRSKEDMIYNVQRNVAEFAAEGWNWKQVVEDHQMFRGINGELIHPVHIPFLRRFTVQQQFLAMRAQASALAKGYPFGHGSYNDAKLKVFP